MGESLGILEVRVTLRPLLLASIDALRPAVPAPMMRISVVTFFFVVRV